jgi:hypothetical protein
VELQVLVPELWDKYEEPMVESLVEMNEYQVPVPERLDKFKEHDMYSIINSVGTEEK